MAAADFGSHVSVAFASHRTARKPKGDGHLRRGEILQAAERLFVELGYEGATIRRIADEVGVSSTALYMHFRDKSEILLELCEEAFAKLLAQNTEIVKRQMCPVERVRAMLEAYIDFALANPNAYQLLFCMPPTAFSEAQRADVQTLGRRCFEQFRGAVGQVAAEKRLRTGDVEAAAQALWTAAHGLVALLITRPNFEWRPPETLKATLLDGLFDGLVRA